MNVRFRPTVLNAAGTTSLRGRRPREVAALFNWLSCQNYKITGEPGRDNALLATVDTGQSLHRLLFDCGEGCLDDIPVAHRQDIEAVFFSHFHIDHIAGFDSLLRFNWCRPETPLYVFGPAGTIGLIHHRLQGFTWDLVEQLPGEWHVSEIADGELRTSRFLTREGFANEHAIVGHTMASSTRRTHSRLLRRR